LAHVLALELDTGRRRGEAAERPDPTSRRITRQAYRTAGKYEDRQQAGRGKRQAHEATTQDQDHSETSGTGSTRNLPMADMLPRWAGRIKPLSLFGRQCRCRGV